MKIIVFRDAYSGTRAHMFRLQITWQTTERRECSAIEEINFVLLPECYVMHDILSNNACYTYETDLVMHDAVSMHSIQHAWWYCVSMVHGWCARDTTLIRSPLEGKLSPVPFPRRYSRDAANRRNEQADSQGGTRISPFASVCFCVLFFREKK